MKNLIVLALCTVVVVSLTGCGCQPVARSLGGTVNVTVPKGKTLVSATWKQDSLWYLVRDRRPDEKPATQQLLESSTFGVLEGRVNFVEQ